jgi:6-phosphogluconolactonase (cycloisomerase 2 family)
MRSIGFFLLFSLILVPGSIAEEFRIYAPSRDGSSVIVVKATTADSGLKLQKTRTIKATFPARTITSNQAGTILFVSGTPNSNGENGAVIQLKENGDYQSIRTFTLDRDYSYLSLDRSENFLLGCNYGSGNIDVYALGENASSIRRVGGLDEGRKNAHCVLPSPDNRFVYIPYVKDTNGLFQYAFDAKTGTLTALEPKNANPPEGSGPRHMAYHPTRPIAYFSEEQGLGVSIYDRAENGQLTLRDQVRAVPDDAPSEGVSSSDILLMPNGKFLYAGIRGHKHDFDFIAGYAVEDDGGLKPVGLTEADKIPWGLTSSPGGNYVIATGFGSGTLMAFKVATDGTLTRAADLEWDEKISDVVTIRSVE